MSSSLRPYSRLPEKADAFGPICSLDSLDFPLRFSALEACGRVPGLFTLAHSGSEGAKQRAHLDFGAEAKAQGTRREISAGELSARMNEVSRNDRREHFYPSRGYRDQFCSYQIFGTHKKTGSNRSLKQTGARSKKEKKPWGFRHPIASLDGFIVRRILSSRR